jgi:predicted patatin/cPLA2 family phospholipase
MRIDYLVDTIFKQLNPLNVPQLEDTKTKYFIPLTEHDTGFTRFVSNETWFNPYEVMRAAKAIPIFYNHTVRLGGSRYLDGDISTNTSTLIQKAIDEGAKKVFVVTNNHAPTRTGNLAVRMYARTLPRALRTTVINDLKIIPIPTWPPEVEIMYLTPSVPLPAKLYTRKPRKVIESYHIGYGDVMAKQQEIAAFLG